MTTLSRIQTKIRRLTSSPSPSQISDDTINQYIDDFYLYDFPEHLKLKSLHTTYKFYTQANIDTYAFPTQTYVSCNPPVYMQGYQALFSQSEEQFFRIYPKLQTETTPATGDGTATYTFTIASAPFLRNDVLITAVDSTGDTANIIDDGTGGFIDTTTNTAIAGTIDYVTGVVTGLTFINTIPSGNSIRTKVVFYTASRPQAMLFFDNIFTLRPVPNEGYLIEIEVYTRPTAFIDDPANPNATPQLIDWWEFISFGAARKILIDRKDLNTLSALEPFYEEQKKLVLRRTINQQSSERTATIYTEQSDFAYNYNNLSNGF